MKTESGRSSELLTVKIRYVSFDQMITGFNTDVPHEGHVYHVQTEDGGSGNPFLESLIYVGGTIVAKKSTPYTERLDEGADQDAIASLLRRQHQIIIAAIKAGRIEDLIRHTQKQHDASDSQAKAESARLEVVQLDHDRQEKEERARLEVAQHDYDRQEKEERARLEAAQLDHDRQEKEDRARLEVAQHDYDRQEKEERARLEAAQRDQDRSTASSNQPVASDIAPLEVIMTDPVVKPNRPPKRPTAGLKMPHFPSVARADSGGLNFDQVIADYQKRESGQAKLELKVLTPEVFIAGRSIGLRVQVTYQSKPHFDATVTVKIIGTAFKPQVFIGRVGNDGIASFSLALPSFTAGTAAIVIEAQSGAGRGELKNLIRRA